MHPRNLPLVLSLLLACAAPLAWACDTPVYRYAMYRWMPVPYELYAFHRGEPAPAAKELEAKAKEISAAVKPSANLVYISVDLAKDPDMKTIPPEVAAIWKSEASKATDAYLLISPMGRSIFRGELTPADLAALTDSPRRRQLADELARGKAGVFVLLTSSKKEETAKAEKLLAELAAEVRAGKIDLYVAPETAGVDELPEASRERVEKSLPVPHGGKKDGAEKKEAAEAKRGKSPPEIGIVVVHRDDSKEAWLIRQLTSIEPDLPDLDQPMVFTAFGRGRFTPPLVGKGIHRKNLEESLHYVTGACVCTVRDQNPGIDLLTRFDWTAAAEKMAAQHSSEEGARFALRDLQLFPETVAIDPPPSDTKGPAEKEPASESPSKASDTLSPVEPAAKEAAKPKVTVANPPEMPTNTLLLWLGAGLVISITVVAASTWWLLRGAS